MLTFSVAAYFGWRVYGASKAAPYQSRHSYFMAYTIAKSWMHHQTQWVRLFLLYRDTLVFGAVIHGAPHFAPELLRRWRLPGLLAEDTRAARHVTPEPLPVLLGYLCRYPFVSVARFLSAGCFLWTPPLRPMPPLRFRLRRTRCARSTPPFARCGAACGDCGAARCGWPSFSTT